MTIHYVLWASQPDIQIFCDKSWGIPAWDQAKIGRLPNHCFWLDDGRIYTFTKENITCEKCKELLAIKEIIE